VNEEGEQKEDSDSVIQRLVDSHDNEYILSKPHEGLSQVRPRARADASNTARTVRWAAACTAVCPRARG
jgi:hypothetical protein